MLSNSSAPSTEMAAHAVEQTLSYYSKIPASDPKIFISGMASLLMNYPDWVCLRAPHVMKGIPGLFKFCPQIAELRETFDAWVIEKQRSDELLARFMPKPVAIETEWIPPKPRNNTSPAVLCERFGIRAIPPGWDAVEVTRQAARHGAAFPQVVEKILLNPHSQRVESLASAMSERIRLAMERRRQGLTNIPPAEAAE